MGLSQRCRIGERLIRADLRHRYNGHQSRSKGSAKGGGHHVFLPVYRVGDGAGI